MAASPEESLALLNRSDLLDDRLATLDPQAYAVLDALWTDRSDPAHPVPLKGGHLTRNKSAILHNLVAAVRPRRTIEIGLLQGASAIVIMAAARGAEFLGHIAMDPAQTGSLQGAGLKNIERAGLKPLLTFLEAESCYALPFLLLDKPMVMDFAFIDASHHFDHTLLEFFYIDRMLRVGGIIAFDDVSAPAVEAVVNYVALNRHYTCRRVGGLVCAVKMTDDSRHWFEFNKFAVPETEDFMRRKYAQSGKPPRLKRY